jgi:hypothetical protein
MLFEHDVGSRERRAFRAALEAQAADWQRASRRHERGRHRVGRRPYVCDISASFVIIVPVLGLAFHSLRDRLFAVLPNCWRAP